MTHDDNAVSSISIVAPCRNEVEVLPEFLAAMKAALGRLDMNWEIILVDDGSTDGSREAILAAARSDPRIKAVILSRNFGKEAALTAGLDRATGHVVVPIDVDLQDPPEVIATMVAKWREGFDVVHGVRADRGADSPLKRLSAIWFYRLYNSMATSAVPPDAGDFRLLDRRVVEAVRRMPERTRFMKGLLGWPGFRQGEVHYERRPRHAGRTKFSYWRLWNFALDGLTSFTTVPLRIWTYLGMLVAGSAFLYAAFLVVRTLALGVDVPGYASLMVVVLFLGGVQLVSLGVIGEYLGRTYEEVKRRPIYLVEATFNLDEPPSAPEGLSEDQESGAD